MNKATLLPYRPCVGILLLNEAGKAWIGRRAQVPGDQSGEAGLWQMPQGGIDSAEDPYRAALRELWEETNIRSVVPIAEHPQWLVYDLPAELVGKAWRGRYRGQKQKWFALRFTGMEREIDIASPGDGHHKPEFTDWRWEQPEKLPGLIVPFKRKVYEQVLSGFASILGNRPE